MKILAIDTTQEVCSAALQVDTALIFREEHAPRDHTRLILPQVESLLAEAELGLSDLDALAFGRGPGSFTGLRIAAGVTQGLAMGADLPVAPVSSLAALAQGVYRENPQAGHVCTAFDARIGEVYWGNYHLSDSDDPGNGIMVPLTDEAVSAPDVVYLPDLPDSIGSIDSMDLSGDGGNGEDGQWVAAGSGWAAYPQLQTRLGDKISDVLADRVPLARDILPIAAVMIDNNEAVPAGQALPVYLRNKVAQTVEERAQHL